MSESTTPTETKTRHKSFTYRTGLRWVGGRAGMLDSEGKMAFRVASPPEFKGESGVWTPEDLFVAAVNVCTMTTFLAFAERLGIPVESYECEAEGLLEFEGGGFRFTRVVLKPEIVVRTQEAVAAAQKALEDAHHACLVANSIRPPVTIEAAISVGPAT